MSQRILILMPWGMDYMDQPALDAVGPRVRPDTTIEIRNLGDAAPPWPWPAVGIEGAMIAEARRAEAEGFDGVMIGCSGDPCLREVREAVDIPVSAPTESGLLLGRAYGKVAILARRFPEGHRPFIPSRGTREYWQAMAADYGLRDEEHSFRDVYVPTHPDPETLQRLTVEDPARLRELTMDAMTEALHTAGVEQIRASVEEDGANAVYLACTFFSRGVDELGAQQLVPGVPVLNPLVAGTTYLETAIVAKGQGVGVREVVGAMS